MGSMASKAVVCRVGVPVNHWFVSRAPAGRGPRPPGVTVGAARPAGPGPAGDESFGPRAPPALGLLGRATAGPPRCRRRPRRRRPRPRRRAGGATARVRARPRMRARWAKRSSDGGSRSFMVDSAFRSCSSPSSGAAPDPAWCRRSWQSSCSGQWWFGEPAAQGGEPAGDLALDRALGDAGALGDLGHREVLPEAEHEDGALLVRQVAQQVGEGQRELAVVVGRRRARGSRR